MTEERWHRIDPQGLRNLGFYSDEDDEDDDEDEGPEPFFVYSKGGKKWPRLVIRIHGRTEKFLKGHDGIWIVPEEKDTFVVSSNSKKGPGSWWIETDIPVYLVKDVIELLSLFNAQQERLRENAQAPEESACSSGNLGYTNGPLTDEGLTTK